MDEGKACDPFGSKRAELCEAYRTMSERLDRLAEAGDDYEAIRSQIEIIDAETNRDFELLESVARGARSTIAVEMARRQLTYYRDMRFLIMSALPAVFDETQPLTERQEEAAALFAEYSFDFAQLALRQATRSAYAAAALSHEVEVS